ncbi:potassium channel family protein [Lutispora saccharofermentans]|nr:TrkA family potassium uptake protein [Lutispora saccharofermentans]
MKQFVVIGIGRFGGALAKRLYDIGHEVLAVDIDEELIQRISDKVTHAIAADATDENVLRSLGVRNFDVGVVAIGDDIQSSIITTLMLKEMGLKYIVAKAQNEVHAKVLKKLGADRVVFPERDMGIRVAHNLIATNILDIIELSPDYSLLEFEVFPSWIGENLKDLNLRAKYGINVLAIKNNNDNGSINVSPKAQETIKAGDILVVVGSNEDLLKLEKKID